MHTVLKGEIQVKSKTDKLVKSSLLLAIAVISQALGRSYPQISQIFVGPTVNAVLILTALICGTGWGVGVAALTPLLAYVTGQLPQAMAPFLPFIIIGNILLVLCSGLIGRNKPHGKLAGIILGAMLKFTFLYFSALKLIHVFNLGIKPPAAQKLVIMMGYPQLATALLGGAAALVLLKLLEKRKIISS
jgi:riboflavin transporter